MADFGISLLLSAPIYTLTQIQLAQVYVDTQGTRRGAPQVSRIDDPVPQLTVPLAEVLSTPPIQLAQHAHEAGHVGLMRLVHGSILPLRSPIGSLLAFTIWPAFPTSDYYANSVPMSGSFAYSDVPHYRYYLYCTFASLRLEVVDPDKSAITKALRHPSATP